ncbi:MAG: guanylate kinase [Candidatus Caldatribacteriota bacterium]|nr:guanylate kinase [Candidatus Caldatribacteriota bacterium]
MIKNNKDHLSFISKDSATHKKGKPKTKKGLLFVVSGPSGVGKGTLREKLFEIFTDLTYSVSVTSRIARKNEENGKDYYFVTEDEFKKMIKEDKFVEWAIVHGDYKGTPYNFTNKKLENGEDILLEIDVQGAEQVKEKMPMGVFIFIAPPSWEDLEERLKNRKTEEKEKLKKRLKDARTEIKYINKYNYLVVNDNIANAMKKLEAIIIAERCKVDN